MAERNRYYRFDIIPMPYVPAPKKKGVETAKHKKFLEYKAELKRLVRAQYFRPSGAMKIVFVLPHHHEVDMKRRVKEYGELHKVSPKDPRVLSRLIEGIRYSLLVDQEMDLSRVDAAKYYGEQPCIIIKNIPEKDFEYLRQGFI